MKTPTDNEIDALEAAARRWVGTPFAADACVRGAGVCCHRLVQVIYVEAGWLPADLVVPTGAPGWSAVHARSLMAEWVEASGLFAEVPLDAREPGDLLGFRLGLAVHHLGIALRRRAVAHALRRHGACISEYLSDDWTQRLTYVWRLNR